MSQYESSKIITTAIGAFETAVQDFNQLNIDTFWACGYWNRHYRGADKSLARPPQRLLIKFTELILEDRRISVKSVAEQLGISREPVWSIIHEDLDMLVACLLPGRAKDLSAPL
jgi:hypothetical protein